MVRTSGQPPVRPYHLDATLNRWGYGRGQSSQLRLNEAFPTTAVNSVGMGQFR